MVKRKPYGLENEKVAGNTPRKGMPLALDDRLISKQYITERIDTKVDDTAFGSSWDYVEGSNENNKVAPSKNAVYDKINSLGVVSDVWTKESSAADSKIRANKTGNYGIGDGNSLNFATIDEKLYIAGNVKALKKSVTILRTITKYFVF